MFTPLDIGTTDNFIAMDIEDTCRMEKIDKLIADLLAQTTVAGRERVANACTLNLTDKECRYIEDELRKAATIRGCYY